MTLKEIKEKMNAIPTKYDDTEVVARIGPIGLTSGMLEIHDVNVHDGWVEWLITIEADPND